MGHAAGILWADRLWSEAPVGSGAVRLRLASWLLLGLAAWLRPPAARALVAGFAAVFVGASAHAVRFAAADAAPSRATATSYEGVVARVEGRTRILRALRDAEGHRALPQRVALVLGEEDGPLADAHAGERWRLHGVLRPLAGLRNPGGFDGDRRWRRRGVGARLRVSHRELAVRVGGEGEGPIRRLSRWRRERIERVHGLGAGGALLAALSLGDRAGLAREDRERFAALGLAHLLAVSGLHLTLAFGLVFTGSRWLFSRSAALCARGDARRPALATALVATSVYALLTGPAIPVQRAWILLAALGLAWGSGRPRQRFHPLALASLWILGRDPAALFDAGFQLSFAATAGLVAAGLPEPGPEEGRTRRWLRSLAHASTLAILATAPLAAWHFGQVAPVGVLANLVAVPWTAFVLLPVSGLACLATGFEGPVGTALASAAERLAAASLAAVSLGSARLPVLDAVARPAAAVLPAALAFAGLAVRVTRLRMRIALLAAQSLLLALGPSSAVAPPPPRVVFFDVGQGDAALVQGRRAALLVDAGTAIETERGGFDAGRSVVVPALRALGVARLERIVVSHGDLDHAGGVASVLARVPAGAVWVPRGARTDPGFDALREAAARRGVAVEERGRGDPPETLGDLHVEFLWPPAGGLGRNDGSLVLRVTLAGTRLLLPGDIEAHAEQRLLASGAPLAAEWLKLPHHGSRTSSTAAWLAAVGPVLAVASAPCNGRFEMPHPDVRQRLAAAGVRLLWTGRDGAVLAGAGPGRSEVRTWGAPRPDCGAPRVRRYGPRVPVFPGESR